METQNQHSHNPASHRLLRSLPILFFFSGVSSLLFETIFTRLLTYTFGNTAQVASTVLAAFLGGLALGAYVFGKWVDRRRPSVWIYGTLELLTGVYGIFIPRLFALTTDVYVGAYHAFRFGPGELLAIRFFLAAAVIAAPAALMGGTLPVLARYLSAHQEDFLRGVDRLYAVNTWGAAAGTFASTYIFMPNWGVLWTLGIACATNFSIFGFVAFAAREPKELAQPHPTLESREPVMAAGQDRRFRFVLLLAAAFLTGAASLAYEVIWTHILAFMVGNTVYAFGSMLFTFLVGLALGAHIVARRLRRPDVWVPALVLSQFFTGLVIFISIPAWNFIPDVFAQGLRNSLRIDVMAVAVCVVPRALYLAYKTYHKFLAQSLPWKGIVELAIEGVFLAAVISNRMVWLAHFPSVDFVAGEALRFFCAFFMLIVPALLLGISFPLLLNLASGRARDAGSSVGGIYSANTLGAIAGSVAAGFFFISRFGSLSSLCGAAAANIVLAAAFVMVMLPLPRIRKWAVAAGAVSLLALLWVSHGKWDAKKLSRGSYVYFDHGWAIDQVYYFHEDIQGGLTSVVQSGPNRVLLSNGKFQGNNTGEVGEQVRFALTPILFTRHFNRALVIGLGTGNTLRVVSLFPFHQIDAVELAPSIVTAAQRWFPDINGLVFDRDPRVKLSITDGRNFLLLSEQRYDLITLEVTSIWISGEADLYNKEFYELARQHMTPAGVLQQWVQLHHMRLEDLLVILNTAAQVFPHVAFFMGHEQGLLIASSSPLQCDARRIESFEAEPSIRRELDFIKVPSMMSLLGELMLYGPSVQRALAYLPKISGLPASFASTDLFPYLEYQTPRGNALPYNTVPINIRFLEALRPDLPPPELELANFSSQSDQDLVMGYIDEREGNLQEAMGYFERVEGPEASRARVEIEKIQRLIN